MVVRECVLCCKLDFIRQARQFFHACDKCLLEGLSPLVGQHVEQARPTALLPAVI